MLIPCPECNWDDATPAMVGWVWDPDNSQANSEGLVKCDRCKGEGYIEG